MPVPSRVPRVDLASAAAPRRATVGRQRPGRRPIAAVAAAALGISVLAGVASARIPSFTEVGLANPRVANMAAPNIISPELANIVVAQGSMKLDGGTPAVPFYGYDGDGDMLPSGTPASEAHKTEPDKNTYLELRGQTGADPVYDYGTHFLFQGHETGTTGAITRINLDADGAHRVSLLATKDAGGTNLPLIDGSTWNPFTRTLLFTSENGANGGVWEATTAFPSSVTDVSAILGRGGYEGIQLDSDGNIWIVEDVGGAAGTDPAPVPAGSPSLTKAKQPNSFVYRFIPNDRTRISAGGKLQVLQIADTHGTPITFHAADVNGDITSLGMKDLHTYGSVLATKWLTIHDTATAAPGAFDANALAKAAGGTPLKRPENGLFRPATDFSEFWFDETGDTNALSAANAAFGGWGAVLRLVQKNPSASTGTIAPFYVGDQAHSGLDNTAWLDRDHIIFVEDAGDTLHAQRNALDSAYLFDASTRGAPVPVRFLAEGRDASATLDAANAGFGRNEGDNEITGMHVSDGDPSIGGLLGRKNPDPWKSGDDGHGGWRVFWTQQHGDNVTYEIVRIR